jgi:hypothetical protein
MHTRHENSSRAMHRKLLSLQTCLRLSKPKRKYYFADFFQPDTQSQSPDASADIEQKIKLGDAEYTQDELQQLVGLGKIGLEAQQKYNTSIDKVYPQLSRTIQEKQELEKRLAEYETQKTQQKVQAGEQLTPEEMKRQALQQADDLGLIHSGNIEQRVLGIMQGYQLLNDANGFLQDQYEAGNPKTTTEDLLSYMNGQNPTGTRYGSIQKAYKDMFETELDQIKQTKVESLKPERFVTTERSTAGAKQPQLQKPNKDNLADLVSAALRGS